MGLIDFESAKGRTRLNYVYSIGAAVVILGALFKILHLPGGSVVIAVGLITEAALFVMFAFEPQHEDLHWDRVYPELAEGADPSTFAKASRKKADTSDEIDKSLSDKLDKMFASAKLDVAKIEQFGRGLEEFSQVTQNLSQVIEVDKNAQSYSDQLSRAADNMSKINSYYESHVEQASMQSDISKFFMDAAKSSATYGEELNKATSRIQSINSMYSDQLSVMGEQVNASSEMIENMSASVEDSRNMHEQVKELTNNLASLNSVYGNMLSAMKF